MKNRFCLLICINARYCGAHCASCTNCVAKNNISLTVISFNLIPNLWPWLFCWTAINENISLDIKNWLSSALPGFSMWGRVKSKIFQLVKSKNYLVFCHALRKKTDFWKKIPCPIFGMLQPASVGFSTQQTRLNFASIQLTHHVMTLFIWGSQNRTIIWWTLICF